MKLKKRFAEFGYRLTRNRSVFYGVFLVMATLIAGVSSNADGLFWRSAGSFGSALAIVGLLHVLLDMRATGEVLHRDSCRHTGAARTSFSGAKHEHVL